MRTEQEELSYQYSHLKERYYELRRSSGDYTELLRKHEVLKDSHKKLQAAYNQKSQISQNLQRENERLSARVKELQQKLVECTEQSPSKKYKKQLEEYANRAGTAEAINVKLREEIRQLKQKV